MIKLQVNHREGPLSSTISKDVIDLIERKEQPHPRPIEVGVGKEDKCTRKQCLKIQKPIILPSKDKQQKTIESIKATTQKVKKDLQDLIDQYKCQAEKMMTNKGYDPEKEISIRQRLKQLQKEKQERRQKFQRDLEKLENKKKSLEKITDKSAQQIEEKKKSIQRRIKKIHQRQQKRHQQYANFLKFYNEYKSMKPKYKILEQQFIKKQQLQKQSKQSKLKQRIKQTFKPMDMQQLSQFQEEYINNKYELSKQRLQNQLLQKKRQQDNQRKLSELYKGHSHNNIMKEFEFIQKHSDEAQDKLKRVKEYSSMVKEDFRPRVKSSIDAQEQQIQGKLPATERGKRTIKDKYLKGEYLGKIVEYKKQALTHNQQVRKGIQYLQYLKKLPKKQNKTETQNSVILPERKKNVSSVYRVKRQQNPLYSNRRYNSIDFSCVEESSQGTRRVLDYLKHKNKQLEQDEKLLKNNLYCDRSHFMVKQNDFNSQLVKNISEKLQILKRL